MLAIGLIIGGGVAMLLGGILLAGWVSGKNRWFDPDVYDRRGARKTDRQFLYLHFVSMVIALLLGGAIMICFGLRELL